MTHEPPFELVTDAAPAPEDGARMQWPFNTMPVDGCLKITDMRLWRRAQHAAKSIQNTSGHTKRFKAKLSKCKTFGYIWRVA